MSRRLSLAPTLRLVVECLEEGAAPGLCENWERAVAARELSALLALARAVHRFEVSDTEYEPVTAAYNRLRKVSGVGARRRAARRGQ